MRAELNKVFLKKRGTLEFLKKPLLEKRAFLIFWRKSDTTGFNESLLSKGIQLGIKRKTKNFFFSFFLFI